jgi:nitrate/nitrite transport system permease protein
MTANLKTRSSRNTTTALSSDVLKLLRKTLAPIVAIAIFLLVWQLLMSGEKPSLPSPLTVIKETWNPLLINPFFDNGGTDKGLFWQISASLQRVGIGFALSAFFGIGLGILIGSNQLMYNAVDPIFQVLRTIPPLAWLPISLAAFSQFDPANNFLVQGLKAIPFLSQWANSFINTANLSAIFVIFITAIWPIIINTTVGVQQIPQDYHNVSRVLQLSKIEYFFNILFPSTVPYIFTGLRIGIGLSWLAIVAAEMLVGGVGIGFFIWDSYNSGRLSALILALVYVGVVGFILDRVVGFIASLVVPQEQK